MPVIVIFGVPGCLLVLHVFTERSARYAGSVFQLLGIVLALWGLELTRRLFEYPSLTQLARDWMASRPRRPRGEAITLNAGVVAVPGMNAELKVGRGLGPKLSWQERLLNIEWHLGDIRTDLANANAKHASQVDQLRNEMIEKIRASGESVSEVRKRLQESQTGGLWLAAIGLVFLFAGTVLCGIAPDLSPEDEPCPHPEMTHEHPRRLLPDFGTALRYTASGASLPC
jgi:hypothetical protein